MGSNSRKAWTALPIWVSQKIYLIIYFTIPPQARLHVLLQLPQSLKHSQHHCARHELILQVICKHPPFFSTSALHLGHGFQPMLWAIATTAAPSRSSAHTPACSALLHNEQVRVWQEGQMATRPWTEFGGMKSLQLRLEQYRGLGVVSSRTKRSYWVTV